MDLQLTMLQLLNLKRRKEINLNKTTNNGKSKNT